MQLKGEALLYSLSLIFGRNEGSNIISKIAELNDYWRNPVAGSTQPIVNLGPGGKARKSAYRHFHSLQQEGRLGRKIKPQSRLLQEQNDKGVLIHGLSKSPALKSDP